MDTLIICSYCLENNKEIRLGCGHGLCKNCLNYLKENGIQSCPMDECLKVQSFCPIHNLEYTRACLDDFQPICKKCAKLHKGHNLVQCSQLDSLIDLEMSDKHEFEANGKNLENVLNLYESITEKLTYLNSNIKLHSKKGLHSEQKLDSLSDLARLVYFKPSHEVLKNEIESLSLQKLAIINKLIKKNKSFSLFIDPLKEKLQKNVDRLLEISNSLEKIDKL